MRRKWPHPRSYTKTVWRRIYEMGPDWHPITMDLRTQKGLEGRGMAQFRRFFGALTFGRLTPKGIAIRDRMIRLDVERQYGKD